MDRKALRAGIEPEAAASAPEELEAQYSIAISLKRIADSLEELSGAHGSAGLEQMLYTLGQSFSQGMRSNR